MARARPRPDAREIPEIGAGCTVRLDPVVPLTGVRLGNLIEGLIGHGGLENGETISNLSPIPFRAAEEREWIRI